jgi:uncharacterized membrane protein YhaH (DUF805 family)
MVKEIWLTAAGFVLGWLTSKTWSDPGCQVGLAIFLVVTAVLVLVFAVAVTAPRKHDGDGDDEPKDKDAS